MSSSKKKRVRTSFKHQQLRIMKAHFQQNPNPDSKDLKELSEKTGLQKRVLQVWFQNSRAKQRKNIPTNLSSNGTMSIMLTGNVTNMNGKNSNNESFNEELDDLDENDDDDLDYDVDYDENTHDLDDSNNKDSFQLVEQQQHQHQHQQSKQHNLVDFYF